MQELFKVSINDDGKIITEVSDKRVSVGSTSANGVLSFTVTGYQSLIEEKSPAKAAKKQIK